MIQQPVKAEMIFCQRREESRSRRRCMAGAAVALGVIIGGCGGGPADTTPPSRTAASASQRTATASPQEMVRTAYLAFWDSTDRALKVPPEQIRMILQRYSTGSYLDFQVRQMLLMQSRGQEPWGDVVRHINKIEVSGGKATLHDCQDASGAGLADARTHQLIENTRGPKQRNLVAYLILGNDGQWRVESLKQFKKGC